MFAGDHDIERAVTELEAFLPVPLRPLARVAYDYRWSWSVDGAAMFEAIDPERWARTGHNPRRLLTETQASMLERAAEDLGLAGWVERLAAELAADRARPWRAGAVSPEHPVAFFCSEFGVHGSVPIDDESVTVQVWRVDVGRVPLYLLDTDLPENSQVGRWVTSRLYDSTRAIRLAQYAVLGVGGVRALRALGLSPGVYHLNEGHPVLGVFELLAQAQARTGSGAAEAWQRVREQVVFTTHTPVLAGNETYQRSEVLAMLGRIADLGSDCERFLAMGRIDPGNPEQPTGMTVIALRASRHANAVSRRHGEVARAMWQPLFPGRTVDEVPISHVTDGVHIPTWLHGPMRELLDRHLGEGWLSRADQPATWAPVRDIPASELWAARGAARRLGGGARRRAPASIRSDSRSASPGDSPPTNACTSSPFCRSGRWP